MYILNTVKNLNNLVVDIFKILYRIWCAKIKKNRHILLARFIKTNDVKKMLTLFFHTNSLLMYILNIVKKLNNLLIDIF